MFLFNLILEHLLRYIEILNRFVFNNKKIRTVSCNKSIINNVQLNFTNIKNATLYNVSKFEKMII